MPNNISMEKQGITDEVMIFIKVALNEFATPEQVLSIEELVYDIKASWGEK